MSIVQSLIPYFRAAGPPRHLASGTAIDVSGDPFDGNVVTRPFTPGRVFPRVFDFVVVFFARFFVAMYLTPDSVVPLSHSGFPPGDRNPGRPCIACTRDARQARRTSRR